MAFLSTAPLTTIFAPPLSCTSSWTYLSYDWYDIPPEGLLRQQELSSLPNTECFPTPWIDFGIPEGGSMLYSPGWCPLGYTTAQSGQMSSSITTVSCCPR